MKIEIKQSDKDKREAKEWQLRSCGAGGTMNKQDQTECKSKIVL